MTWPRRIEVFALSRLKLKWPNLTRNILCYRLENNKTGVSQSRNLKTTTFTESSATDVLILAALVHNLCLWSSMVCCASPYLAALCLSLWAYHFPLLLLLLLPFPPRPRTQRVCSLEVGLLGGWGGGVYMELLSCALFTDSSEIVGLLVQTTLQTTAKTKK